MHVKFLKIWYAKTRAGVSTKILETETRLWHFEIETWSKKSRRDRDINETRHMTFEIRGS